MGKGSNILDNENLDNGLDNSILNNEPGSEMPETNIPDPEMNGSEMAKLGTPFSSYP